MTVGGIHLIGINAQTGEKALLTLILVLALAVVRAVYVAVMALIYRRNKNNRVRFWLRQALNLLSAIVLVLGLIYDLVRQPGKSGGGVRLVLGRPRLCAAARHPLDGRVRRHPAR